MNNKAEIVLVFFLFILTQTCHFEESKIEVNQNTRSQDIGLCDNELDLLLSDKAIADTDWNLFEIRQNIKNKLNTIDSNINCENKTFNVIFQKDSTHSVPLSLNTYYVENCTPPPFTPRLWCHILINTKGQILVESELCETDSVKYKIVDFYKSELIKQLELNDYSKIMLALYWDEGLDGKTFSTVVTEVIKGYTSFANQVAHDKYGKRVCELSRVERSKLKTILPFNLRTDFLMGLEVVNF